MKTVDTPDAPQTGLAMLAPAAEKSRKNMHEQSSVFLPRFKIVHPMEADSLPEYLGQAVISQSGDVTALKAPYVITTLNCRKGIKYSYKKDDKDCADFGYEDGETHDDYNSFLPKVVKGTRENPCPYKPGKTYLLAVFPKHGQCVLASGDFFGGGLWYWEKNLGRADYAEGAGIQVLIDDHRANYKKEFKNYDGKLFKQYKQIELTPDHLALLKEVCDAKTASIAKWLTR